MNTQQSGDRQLGKSYKTKSGRMVKCRWLKEAKRRLKWHKENKDDKPFGTRLEDLIRE